MEDAQIRHLEMIQGVVTRLAQNSFAYKGWAITLVTGILALAAARDVTRGFAFVALIPAAAFWGLDGYYLRQERLFRRLYDVLRSMPTEDWQSLRFSMDTHPHAGEEEGWLGVCMSRTLVGLYLPMIAVIAGSGYLVYR